jgi:hypothetical protein
MPGLPGAELLVSATLALVAGVLLGLAALRGCWCPRWPCTAMCSARPVMGWSAMPVATYLARIDCSVREFCCCLPSQCCAQWRSPAEPVFRPPRLALGLVGAQPLVRSWRQPWPEMNVSS